MLRQVQCDKKKERMDGLMKECVRCSKKFDGDGKLCNSCLVDAKLDSMKSVDDREVRTAILKEYGEK